MSKIGTHSFLTPPTTLKCTTGLRFVSATTRLSCSCRAWAAPSSETEIHRFWAAGPFSPKAGRRGGGEKEGKGKEGSTVRHAQCIHLLLTAY